MITALFASAGILFSGLAAQDGSRIPASPPAQVQEDTQPDAALAPPEMQAAARQPRIRMIDRGEEPRVELRYSFAQGDVFRADFVQTMAMLSTDADGDPLMPEMKLPPIRQRVRLTVREVVPASTLYDVVWEKVSVDDDPEAMPEVIDAMHDSLGGLVGMRGWFRIDPRGRLLEARMEVPDGADPLVAQMMEGMETSLSEFTPPFPEESVGRGAHWIVESAGEMMDIPMIQSSAYRLLAIRDGEVHLKVETDATIGADAKQPVGRGEPGQERVADGQVDGQADGAAAAAPGAAAGEAGDAGRPDAEREDGLDEEPEVRGTTKGAGEVWISPNLPMPRKATLEAVTNTETSMTIFGDVHVIKQRMTMTMEIATRRLE